MPPLRFERFAPQLRAVVWRGSETREELLDQLPPAWRLRLPKHPIRVVETLSARRALLALAPEVIDHPYEKDAHGKPFLPSAPDMHFSVSHSHGHASALVSNRACGVDLQLRVEKITRLRRRFETPAEQAFIVNQPDEIGALHVLWGAKEALFKLYGKREINWLEHLIVSPFEHSPGGGAFYGRIQKNGVVLEAQLWFRWVDDYCLVAAGATSEG